ncbi:unnamed protein product [Heterobilharzia americana]|nr:unnamed protein product [Heterobilharzia americana]
MHVQHFVVKVNVRGKSYIRCVLQRIDRAYCFTCDCLFSISVGKKKHRKHEYTKNFSKNLLSMPSYLLKPLENSKAHAQYFFSLDCLNRLYSIIYKLSVNYIICIGSPRLHDFIQLQCIHRGQSMNSYLLDIDFRLTSFYRPCNNFSRYNMVNGFFFSPQDEKLFYCFLKENVKPMNKLLIFCDPPFAAPLSLIIKQIELLSKSMIKRIYQNAEVDEDNIAGYDGYSEANKSDIPYLLVLPYFFEKKLQKIAPSVNLLDYKITYENHSRMDYDKNDMEVDEMTTSNSNKSNTGQRRDSIVRLFTSLPPSSVHPPKSLEASFRFCEICQRYSHITNLHCAKCNRCTTKNGPTYVHCDKCGRCRPTKKFHCDSCECCVSVNQCAHQLKRRKLS